MKGLFNYDRNSISNRVRRAWLGGATLLALPGTAMAHGDHSEGTGDFWSSLAHWLTEPDHLIIIGASMVIIYLTSRRSAKQKK